VGGELRAPGGSARALGSGPSVWAQVAATFGVFFGGAGAGIALARVVAPGSDVAQFVAFLVLPLALATGFQLWLGAAIVLLLPRLVRAIRRREWRADVVTPAEEIHDVPPGHGAFVVTGTGWGAAAGLIVGFLPSASSFIAAAGAFVALGLGYGLLTRALARRGLLSFPVEG
jgi:hypothetical protein